MNRGTRGRIPQNTNPTGTRGRGGRNPTLGRQTFVDEIIARADSSSGSIFHPANPPRRRNLQSSELPLLETSFSSRAGAEAEVEAEDLSPTNQQATLENIEDQGSIVRNRENPEEAVYRINGRIVTKEEWDAFHIEWREREHMENQGDNEEEFLQENPRNNEDQVNNENTISTLVFPISDVPTRGMAPMKNIPLSALPNFHGLSTEDPDEFLFEFDILCRSYDYTTTAQKLKLFPATLKGNALRWFMSLGGENISTWVQMRQLFLNKYQDYCRTRERREELFKMSQKEDETLEDFVERLQYNLQRSGHPDVSKDILKTILLKGVREDCLDILNMLGKGDISKESYEDIVDLCKRCSRGSTKNRSATKDTTFSRVQKSANGGATRAEIGNLLENFKTEMINSFASQIDTLQIKQKQAESEQALCIFCPKCRKKHPPRECPLNSVQVCLICELDHATDQCPSLPGVKASMKETNEEAEVAYLITQRRQWQPRSQGMNSQFSPATLNYWNNQPLYGQTNAPPPHQMSTPYQDPNAWLPMPQQQNHHGQWNPYWRGPQQQLSYQNHHQPNPYQQQFQPQYQQQQLQLPPNAPLNNPPL
jgi:hypothetical protein